MLACLIYTHREPALLRRGAHLQGAPAAAHPELRVCLLDFCSPRKSAATNRSPSRRAHRRTPRAQRACLPKFFSLRICAPKRVAYLQGAPATAHPELSIFACLLYSLRTCASVTRRSCARRARRGTSCAQHVCLYAISTPPFSMCESIILHRPAWRPPEPALWLQAHVHTCSCMLFTLPCAHALKQGLTHQLNFL